MSERKPSGNKYVEGCRQFLQTLADNPGFSSLTAEQDGVPVRYDKVTDQISGRRVLLIDGVHPQLALDLGLADLGGGLYMYIAQDDPLFDQSGNGLTRQANGRRHIADGAVRSEPIFSLNLGTEHPKPNGASKANEWE